MLLIRILLQLAFGLVAAFVLFIALRAPDSNLVRNLIFVAFFALIILVLGPWWPSAAKMSKLKADLATDALEARRKRAKWSLGIGLVMLAGGLWGLSRGDPLSASDGALASQLLLFFSPAVGTIVHFGLFATAGAIFSLQAVVALMSNRSEK